MPGGRLFLTSSEAVFVISKPEQPPRRDIESVGRQPEAESALSSVVRLGFEGANANPQIQGEGLQEGRSNYFIGNDPAKWRTDVPNYDKVRYYSLYPGIDAVFYSRDGQLEYDFELAPEADPSQISLRVSGADGVEKADDGSLLIHTPAGDIVKGRPNAFQDSPGRHLTVGAEYQVDDTGRIGLAVEPYDRSQPLTIDPTVAYASYLGGSKSDVPQGVAVDASGSSYIGGYTQSLVDFPLSNPFQSTFGGGPAYDAYITKVNASGSAIVYSSYLGGSRNDQGSGIAVDASGNAYIAGSTSSTDFPTAGAFQSSSGGGGNDSFITKVNPSGSAIVYSSYLGGNSSDNILGVSLDSSGNAYMVGDTSSANFPTVAPFQAVKRGPIDAFITKVNSSGTGIIYSSYLGGSGVDEAKAVAVDSSGNAYITGGTTATSAPFFPTVSPFQSNPFGKYGAAFVTKVNPSGSALAYSSFLGGSDGETGRGIAVDSFGAAYVTGSTASPDFPTTAPFQATCTPCSHGGGNAFITKVNPSGSAKVYSSFLGGSSGAGDFATGVAVDAGGNAIVVGETLSADFPVTAPVQTVCGGCPFKSDMFVAKINPAGSATTYSSFMGGSADDRGRGAAVDLGGNAYVVGYTSSTDFPTVSPFQAVCGCSPVSYDDTLVAKIAETEVISGTFTGGTWGSISVYGAQSGQLVAYSCCMTSDSWSISVPAATCPAGYKILYNAPDNTTQTKWYNLADNYSSADCVSAPSSGNDMTVPSSGVVSGYVKDKATAADLDGVVVYAFRASDGTYVGYSVSGESGGAGRISFTLDPSTSYKFKAFSPPGHASSWWDGKNNFTEATSVMAPATVNFSLDGSASFVGYVKDKASAADLNGYPIYVYDESGIFVGYGVTDRGQGQGRYAVEVLPGVNYKLLSQNPNYSTQWYSGGSSFSDATANAAPTTANFSLS